jgi:hypothetical protein
MSKLTAADWERLRADNFVSLMRQVLTAGIDGADAFAPVLASWLADSSSLRATAYATFRAMTTPWEPFTPGAGWVAFGPAYVPPQYRRTADGGVELRGLMASGSVGGGNYFFTAPEGARPSLTCNVPIITNTGVGRVEIDNLGRVAVVSGGNTYASLDGVRWSPQ